MRNNDVLMMKRDEVLIVLWGTDLASNDSYLLMEFGVRWFPVQIIKGLQKMRYFNGYLMNINLC